MKPISLEDRLFAYADKYRTKAEAAGQGSRFPTIRECARRFRMKQQTLYDLAENMRDNGMRVDIIVGMGTYGGGFGVYENVGDYELETWPEDKCPTPCQRMPLTA